MLKGLAATQPTKSTQNLATSKTKQAAELQELDARLKRICDTKIQRTPYILSVPSDRPYNLDPRRPHDWRRGTPFDDHEEQLQYLSFLADWDHGLITPLGGWDNDRGEIMDRSNSQQSAKSGVSATASGAKVKYSLSDYKKKAAGQPISGTLGGTLKESSGSTKVNGALSKRPQSPSSRPDHKTLKRPREDGEISEGANGVQSPKKKRPSPAPVLELPPDISPTLPPAIEKELARLEKLSSLSSLDEPKRPKPQGPASITRQTGAITDKRRLVDKDLITKKAERPSDRGTVPKVRPKEGDRPSVVGGSLNGVSKEERPAEIDRPSKPAPKPSKMVRLRIPKSIRNNIVRLLKIPPRSKKQPEATGKGVARRIGRTSPQRDRSKERDKRSRTDEDDDPRLSAKRAKHTGPLDSSKPMTPVPAPSHSPSLSHHGSTHKAIASSEGHSKHLNAPTDDGPAVTPLAAIRNGTPIAPDSIDRSSKDSRTVNMPSRAQRTAIYSELRQVEKDMFTLGRNSKHSSDHELNDLDGETSPQRVMRGLAFGFECILAFMLSYTVRDEMNRLIPPDGSSSETWTTIFPYIQRIKRTASNAEHKHLLGLCLQLEAVCHLSAWTNETERASNASHPPNLPALMKHYHSATASFIEATSSLSVEELQRSFPHAWRAKSITPLAARPNTCGNGGSSGPQRLDVRAEGEYSLPITSITTGVEAVRVGRKLLVEWCALRNVDWVPTLGQTKKKESKIGREEGP